VLVHLLVVLDLRVGHGVHVLVLRDELLVVHQGVLKAHLVRVEAAIRVLPKVWIVNVVELGHFVLLHGLLVLVLEGVAALVAGALVLGHLLPVEGRRVQHLVLRHGEVPQILR